VAFRLTEGAVASNLTLCWSAAPQNISGALSHEHSLHIPKKISAFCGWSRWDLRCLLDASGSS
jgi:hypothetical protein